MRLFIAVLINFLFLRVLNVVQCQSGIMNGRVDAVTELLESAKYTSETHRVETEDGYLLKVHRILPRGLSLKKGPVLLIHGLFGTSADFLLTGPDNALGYQLADGGYDVWMGNVRGSRFSMRHRSIDPQTREFWQFSFHEIGFYDLPAMIQYILSATQKPGLFYVGHNQGATALLVLLSTRTDFNSKVYHAHFMAPIAFMDNPHPLFSFQSGENLRASRILGNYNFYSLTDLTNLIIKTYCPDRGAKSMNYCTNLWFFLFGRNLNYTEIDSRTILEVPKYISPTASVKQWNHFLQISIKGKFRSFDGRSDSISANLAAPTEYNLANVKTPVYIYQGAQDLIVSRLDVDRLKSSLSNVREYRIISNWNHMDFVFSQNAERVLYNNILSSLNNDGFDIIGIVKNILGISVTVNT